MAYLIKNLKYKNILNIKKLEIKNKINIVSGESGIGKSTLFHLLTGKDYNYEGEIYLNDNLIKDVNTHDIFKHISFLDQNYILLTNTIKDEFKYICDLLDLEYDETKIKKLLQICDLDLGLAQDTSNLSGGQVQRLCLARTLYPDKEVILLDEPTSALDQNTTQIIMDNFQKYSEEENKTFIIISHNESIINNHNFNQIHLGDYNERS